MTNPVVQEVIRQRADLHFKIISAVRDVPDRERAMNMILNWVPLAVLKEIQLEFLKPIEDRDG